MFQKKALNLLLKTPVAQTVRFHGQRLLMWNIQAFKRTFSFFQNPILHSCLILSQLVLPLAQAQGGKACRAMVTAKKEINSLEDLQLTVMAYNFAGLALPNTPLKPGSIEAKARDENKFRFRDPEKVKRQQALVAEINPDIMIGTEVYRVQDMQDFLNGNSATKDQYHVFLKTGNDPYGSDISIAVKKSLSFRYKLTSHKSLQWTDSTTGISRALYSRDLPVIAARIPGNEIPDFLVVGNHAKSKRNDDNGRAQRQRDAQYDKAEEIIEALQDHYLKLHGVEIPVMMAGDYNLDVIHETDKTFLPGLTSVFDKVVGKTILEQDRDTHVFFGPNGREFHQLDDIRVSSGLQVLSASVYEYKNKKGQRIPDPKTFEEREKNPGDHRPVVAVLKNFAPVKK